MNWYDDKCFETTLPTLALKFALPSSSWKAEQTPYRLIRALHNMARVMMDSLIKVSKQMLQKLILTQNVALTLYLTYRCVMFLAANVATSLWQRWGATEVITLPLFNSTQSHFFSFSNLQCSHRCFCRHLTLHTTLEFPFNPKLFGFFAVVSTRDAFSFKGHSAWFKYYQESYFTCCEWLQSWLWGRILNILPHIFLSIFFFFTPHCFQFTVE